MAILVTLLFIGVTVPVNATLTTQTQDIAWTNTFDSWLKIFIDDGRVLLAAVNSDNLTMIWIACKTEKDDIVTAEVINQATPVSSDM